MLSEYQINLLNNVEKCGFHQTLVFDPERVQPTFSCTVGFTKTLNSPEIIIFGLPFDTMKAMAWEMFHQIKAGKSLKDGQKYSDIIQSYDVIAKPVHPTQMGTNYFYSAVWYWRAQLEKTEPFQAYQIVWPDMDQTFPFEENFDERYRWKQLELYKPFKIEFR